MVAEQQIQRIMPVSVPTEKLPQFQDAWNTSSIFSVLVIMMKPPENRSMVMTAFKVYNFDARVNICERLALNFSFTILHAEQPLLYHCCETKFLLSSGETTI